MYTPSLADLPPDTGHWVEIDIQQQTLTLWQGREAGFSCLVSTGKAGAGQQEGSGKTPLGWHYVRAAIGAEAPMDGVFRGRRWTGEVYTPALGEQNPDRDWILTRILWLCGLERGFNRGGDVDAQRRFIYLHGTPPSEPMGQPMSHGCIRLKRDDLLHVFASAVPGTPVWIHL
ncbi:L,D-transpeptidase family protein [Halomonas sp. LS-001]